MEKIEHRIEWKIGELTGCGEWQPKENMRAIKAWVSQENQNYGRDTHWIASRMVSITKQ